MSVPQEEVQESLSDILSGKEIDDAPASAESAKSPTGEKEAPPAGKIEAEKPKDDKPEAKPTESVKDAPVKPRPDVAAIIDERRKRQAIERELAELKAGKPAERPSVFEDEDKAIRSRISEETRSTREAIYHLSRELAETKHGDAYRDAEQAFLEASESDPQLIEALRHAPNPGEFIYRHGTFHRKLAPYDGDVMKMLDGETATLKGEIAERDTRLKALEAQVAELTRQKTELETLPRSLNSRASGAAPQAGDEDDEDIKQITRFGNKQR